MNYFAARLARAYLALGRRLGVLLVILAAAAATSVVVVLPFWYLATSHRRAFNTAVIGLIAAGLVFVAARRLAGSRAGGEPPALLPALLRSGGLAAWMGLLYVTLWAFASARPLLGVASAVALLLAVGLMVR